MGICKHCGEITKGNSNFCKNSHYILYQRNQNRIMKMCKHCKMLYGGTPNQKFCCHDCHIKHLGEQSRGENHPNWTGGIHKGKDGYVRVKMIEHHRADVSGYVMEHILVAEKKYGRPILKKEEIHHINLVRDDNRPENLFLFPNGKLHRQYHKALKKNPNLKPEEFIDKMLLCLEGC